MGDIKKGSLDVTQGAQLSQKNIQSGFFKRLLSGLETPKEQLKELKEMLDDELITQEQFESKRDKILEGI